MPTLNPKHQRFVEEYLIDLNATQACIRAGYKAKNADVTGPRLLGNVGIAAAIAEAQAKATAKACAKYEISKERVLGELALLGFSNMEDFAAVSETGSPRLDLSKLNREQWAAVNQIKVDDDGAVTLKLYDKRAALVDLGKHLQIFNETVNVNVNDVTPPSPLDDARRTAFHLERARRLLSAGNGSPRANSSSNGDNAT